ncbi:MAG: hypothetical protein WKF73_11960 [Nocardioidaceae bacterium]
MLAVDEKACREQFQSQLADKNSELTLDDAAKIVGCWNGLAKRQPRPGPTARLHRRRCAGRWRSPPPSRRRRRSRRCSSEVTDKLGGADSDSGQLLVLRGRPRRRHLQRAGAQQPRSTG